MPPTTDWADVPGCRLRPARQKLLLPLHNTTISSPPSLLHYSSTRHEPPMYSLDFSALTTQDSRKESAALRPERCPDSNTRACPTSTPWFPHPAVLTQPWRAFSKYPDGPDRRVWPPVRANLTHTKELRDKI